ncbi:MAG: metalloregulator ArsR/SmtB family transcription factor [candidate division Zixibacteria bacterium]
MSNSRIIDNERYARFFKALSNPNRFQLFLTLVSCCGTDSKWELEDSDENCVGQLGSQLNLAPSTISHHIKELNQAGLIQLERSGQKTRCWISKDVVTELSQFFKSCCCGNLHDVFNPSG